MNKKNDFMATVVAITGMVLFLILLYYILDGEHQKANDKLTLLFENNNTIYCGWTQIPVSKEFGWRIEGERVFNSSDSFDLSQSCRSDK